MLTKNYELHNFNVTKSDSNDNKEIKSANNGDRQSAFDANLISMAYERNEKIKRFKEQKEIEKQLEQMNFMLENSKEERIDDEMRRKTFITYIKYWINNSIDDLKVISGFVAINFYFSIIRLFYFKF
jgi:immunoglobulin-binding protein 1